MSDNKNYDTMPFPFDSSSPLPVDSDGLKVGLRDYFAGQALAGIMANPERHGHQVHAEDEFFIAEDAYIVADAMLVARQKERG